MFTVLNVAAIIGIVVLQQRPVQPLDESDGLQLKVFVGTNFLIPGTDVISAYILNETTTNKVVFRTGNTWSLMRIDVWDVNMNAPRRTALGKRCNVELDSGFDSLWRHSIRPKCVFQVLEPINLSEHFVLGTGKYWAKVTYCPSAKQPTKLESTWIPFTKL